MYVWPKGVILYIQFVPDLASVLLSVNTISTIFTKDFFASHVSQSFPALNEFGIRSFSNHPADMVFYCSQISFENANHAKDKRMRSTSLHMFPPTYYLFIN